ncbi:MAG: hypothetical protein IJZ39_00440 [Oscillospiraceae bacterium]|nr:hypothetical protein [Oscillospiraceae bacterium]
MPKKKKIVKRMEKDKKEIQDTVVFMTAYNIHKFKHHFARFWQRNKRKNLLNQFHIAGISHGNAYVSPDAKCKYTVEYDALKQVSAFHFDENIVGIKENNPRFVEEMMTTLSHHHSANALLDCSQVNISMFFNMESFLVMIGSKTLQVDPVAFMMNESLIVNFELIDFDSGVPLGHKAIYGRSNNYGIQPISRIRYFNETEFSDDNRKIADVVFENVYGFIKRACKGKWEPDNFSYVHNILVMSNEIDKVNDYFPKVLGAQLEEFEITNISATDAFRFYSTEYLGVVTQVKSDDINRILFDCMMLESFKVYLLLRMIIDYEVNHKLDSIIDNQIYVESLFYPAQVPIITLNMIGNLKETVSFKRYKQAIDFKVQALRIKYDRQSTSNGRLMNVLLYVLAMLGSAQTLQVLQAEFGLPFNIAFWVVTGLFVVFGIVWVLREYRK